MRESDEHLFSTPIQNFGKHQKAWTSITKMKILTRKVKFPLNKTLKLYLHCLFYALLGFERRRRIPYYYPRHGYGQHSRQTISDEEELEGLVGNLDEVVSTGLRE